MLISASGDVSVSITDVKIDFGDVVVTSQDSGIISRAETSMEKYSYLPAVMSAYVGDAGQALLTSALVLVT